ncbi:MAG: ABC-2 transporter permease [Lachnospiraceae bacterium]|nr:ABC-2 transporter permease [Lachnospiraceae bacterium]
MLAIYKKEMRSYFTSIIGYLFLGFFLVVSGIYHVVYNMVSGYSDIAYALSGVVMVFILLVPMLTMRLMAEENRQKTDQLLFTSPLSITQIILGKYFVVITVLALAMVVVCIYPLVLTEYGTVNLVYAYTSVLGFYLLGCAYMAIGLFISAVTESQVFAAIVTFVVILITCLMDGIVGIMPTDNKSAWVIFAILVLVLAIVLYAMMRNAVVSVGIGLVGEVVLAVLYFVNPSFYDSSVTNFFGWFSVVSRFDQFTTGILDLSSVIYYLSLCVLFVFLTIQAIKKRRWS